MMDAQEIRRIADALGVDPAGVAIAAAVSDPDVPLRQRNEIRADVGLPLENPDRYRGMGLFQLRPYEPPPLRGSSAFVKP